MAFDFPASPSIDQDYVAGTVTYTYNGTGWVLKGTSTGQFVSKSGDTMVGDLTIAKSIPVLNFDSPTSNWIVGKVNGVNKWSISLGDATGHFSVAGVTGVYSLKADGTTGNVSIPITTASTSPTTGALTVAGGVGIGGALSVTRQVFVNATGSLIWTEGYIQVGKTSVVTVGDVGLIGSNLSWNSGSGYIHTGAGAGSVIALNSGGMAYEFHYSTSRAAGAVASLFAAMTINNVNGGVSINSFNTSSSSSTGALVVTGGVGIGGELITGANITLGTTNGGAGYLQMNSANVAGGGTAILSRKANVNLFATGLDSAILGVGASHDYLIYSYGCSQYLRVSHASGAVNISAGAASTSITTGALVVGGGVGINGNMFLTGAANIRQGSDSYPLSNGGAINIAFGTIGITTRGQNDAGTWHYKFASTADAVVGNITTTASNTTYNTSSDARLKDDLKPFNAGEIIDGIDVHDFKWKSTGERGYGVLAQQAIEIYPMAITYSKEFDWWGVDYSKFVPLLLQEVKSLRNRLNQLEDK